MFKMIVQVRRRPGLSDAFFYPRWHDQHGDLVRSVADAVGFRRYVQAHRLVDAAVASAAARWGWSNVSDGQAELWWESESAMNAALSSPRGIEASRELEVDEQDFTDTKNLSALAAVELPVFDRTAGTDTADNDWVKLVLELVKPASLSQEEFVGQRIVERKEAWLGGGATLGIAKCTANYQDPASTLDFAELRGWMPAPNGLVELWFPNTRAAISAVSHPAFGEVLLGDQAGREQVNLFLAAERRIFDFT